eukprot:Skav200760  [mRNA]  locus=scaffold2001:111991:116283:- [translate_table: standard]
MGLFDRSSMSRPQLCEIKPAPGDMPRTVLSDDERKAAHASASSDLRFLLERQEVGQDNQALFYHHGVTSIEKFASVAKDRDDMADMLKQHWEIDPDRSLTERVQLAAILCAFSNAQTRSQRAAEVEAEYDSKEWVKPIVAGEWQSMKVALEKKMGRIEDKVYPAKEYVEKKLAEVEAAEYRAETLAEVISKEEVDPDGLLPVWDSKGKITLRKGSAKLTDPANPENLRRRLTVLRNCYVMIALKHTNRAELQGDHAAVIEEYKDYLLGDYVWGLVARDGDGNTISTPPWSLVLKYEHSIRKHAVKIMSEENKSYTVALKMAWKDPAVKERNFTTPLALYSKRPAAPPPPPAQGSTKRPFVGQSKGKAKGGSKGQRGCATHTPEGEPICFRFNNGEKCKMSKCKFRHVCGRKRKNSVAGFLRDMAKEHGITLSVEELDIQRKPYYDFTLPRVRERWLQRIRDGRYFAVVVTPPCSTFSRACWANDQGPVPVRSLKCPRGFPWNRGARFRRARLGTILADFSFEAMGAQLQHDDLLAFMEQPEDLGRTSYDRVPGHVPASMWQWPEFQDLLQLPEVVTVAFSQMDFGTTSPKPTRFLMRASPPLRPGMRCGVPQFDEDRNYVGPLERREGQQLIGRTQHGFRTSSSAAWPPPLCRWVASNIFASYLRYSGQGTGAKRKQEQENGDDLQEDPPLKRTKQDDQVEVDPMNPRFSGGYGPPRSCVWKGLETPFHDGGCLMSPGRWRRDKRKFPGGKSWSEMREEMMAEVTRSADSAGGVEKEAFRMAAKGGRFTLVKDEELKRRLREIMAKHMRAKESDMTVAEGQPFHLGLLRRLLEEAGDADCEFLRLAEEGLPVGVLDPLPRTPAAFEEQKKWPLEGLGLEEPMLEKVNYISAEVHSEHLVEHLEQEVAEGLMDKMREEDFVREFGENRAVAALAVLVEDDMGKKRVIHDGSHGVQVNHRIKCLDKVRMPSAREKRTLLEEFHEEKAVVVSLVGDVEKAHRRIKYRRREQGFLGCRCAASEGFVYVNKVGTFGISSTPYWWTRLSACLIRAVHYLLGPCWLLDLLLYADDLEAMGPGRRGRVAVVLAFLYLRGGSAGESLQPLWDGLASRRCVCLGRGHSWGRFTHGRQLSWATRVSLRSPGRFCSSSDGSRRDSWKGPPVRNRLLVRKSVDLELAPWLLCRGKNPKRVIAALEMLASIVAMRLWCRSSSKEVRVYAEAFTDNKGNDFILKKSMSTKYPLTVLVMEASEMMRRWNFVASLTWIKRDENQGADGLTNEDFSKFDMAKRVHIETKDFEWLVLGELIRESEKLYREIAEKKAQNRNLKNSRRSPKEKGKFFKRWSSQ